MNAIPLLLLLLMSGKGGARGAREPAWPSRRSPPPRRARHAPAHKNAARAARHEAPSTHPAAHAEHAQEHAEHAAPHDHTMPVQTEQGQPFKSLDFSQAHAEPAHPGQPYKNLDFSHARAEPAHASTADTQTAEPPAPNAGEYSVDAVQRILVALGWRGHLTTKGPLLDALTDGLYGPVTHDDWQQSANKRGLDATFVRLGPRSVHVDPATYDALRALAKDKGGNVVGIGRGRMMRIP
jgi:hypothetical protein